MSRRLENKVLSTRLLSDSELDNLMNKIGAYLTSQEYLPLVHSRKLVHYISASHGGGSPYVGLFAPVGPVAAGVAFPVGGKRSKVPQAIVQVTDLPIGFGVDDGPSIDVPVGHAFAITAPGSICAEIAASISPYSKDIEQIKAGSGRYIVGMKFDKKVPDVPCDFCGFKQEVTIQPEITHVDGMRGTGPGGAVNVICSNCGKVFELNWPNVTIEIQWAQP